MAEAPVGAETTGELLRRGVERLRTAGSELPRLDAELLLGHAGALDRVAVIAHPEARFNQAAAQRYEAAVARREHGEPVAYIRGIKEFMGLTFHVDSRALIPRPETERLVELALKEVRARAARGEPDRRCRLVDIGTGSGAVAIALASQLRQDGRLATFDILATDVSADALQLAAENLAEHGLAGDVRLAWADLLPAGEGPFDLVLANLPYIATADLTRLPVAATYEPKEALDGGRDGLAVIRRLLARLPEIVASSGTAFVEIGSDQADRIAAAIARRLPGWTWRIESDLSRLPRVVAVERGSGVGDARVQLERSGMPQRAHPMLEPATP